MSPAAHMPYVGECAFAHKAGLHIDAIRKNEKTYEHIAPQKVGNERRFLISELSGASNVLDKLEQRKIVSDKKVARQILKKVQELENAGYQFETAEASFDLLIKKELGTYQKSFDLIKYHIDVECKPDGEMVTEATVKLQVDGTVEHVVSEGDGPVNALDGALRKALEPFYPSIKDMSLIDYKVRTVGVSENIVEASWRALVDSVEYKLLKDAE